MPCTGWPFVELRVRIRHGVDVVQRGVVVLDLQRLADHDRVDVRVVLAALLIEDDRRRRRGEVALDVFDVDEDIGQLAGRADDDFLVLGAASDAATGSTDRRTSECWPSSARRLRTSQVPVSVAASAETAAAAAAAAARRSGAVLPRPSWSSARRLRPHLPSTLLCPCRRRSTKTSVAANNSETNFFMVIDLSPVSNVRLRR